MEQVLVIGGGPSHMQHYEECKNFKGIIVATDRATKAIMDNGVIPDYICTVEAAKELTQMDFFNLEETKKHPIEIIISEETRHELLEAFQEHRIKYTKYAPKGFEPCRLPNVGMTAIHWVKTMLKPDHIILLGFENEGEEYDEYTFRMWATCFFGWVKEWTDKESLPWDYIINCSEGGVLYDKRVKKSTLKEVVSNQ